jgi:hypothetical protein
MRLGKLLKKSNVFGVLLKRGYLNIRTSQLGRCHRALQYSMTRIKQEEASQKTKLMWEDRLLDEARIVRKLKKKFTIKYSGEEQKTFYRLLEEPEEKVIFSSTPDGLIEQDEGWIPLEIKSLNPYRFQAIKSQENLSREYLIQIHGEMLLTKSRKALYAIGNSRTKEELNKFFVTFDDKVPSWMEDRIKYILSFSKEGKWIYPEYLPGSEKCHWCLYKNKCEKDIYKGFSSVYNKIKKIDRDDFEYDRIKELSKRILTTLEEHEDLLLKLRAGAHEFKDLLLKREAGKFKSSKITLKEVNRILGRVK